MTNKHKHHDLIVAMAANTDLVKFHHDGIKWHKTTCDFTFHDSHKYFLCLPKHAETCLHWLNGGYTEMKKVDKDNWQKMLKAELWSWGAQNNTMSEEWEFRIAPKKEKRWIGVNANLNVVTDRTFKTEESITEHIEQTFAYPENIQLIEIEIEVRLT